VRVSSVGDDTSSPSYGCLASFQFRKANGFYVAKWVMFPNRSQEPQDRVVAVSPEACKLDEHRVLIENNWEQNPCMVHFSADVYNAHYNAMKIVKAVSAGREKCKGALTSDLLEHEQSVATLYRVNLSIDISLMGDPDTNDFRCSVVYHVPEYNGNSSPDRLAHWLLYPNKASRRLVAVNSFACDVDAKRASMHPGGTPTLCEND
jgi:hypothetical protein